MDKSKLLRQVFGTYNWLRFGMVVIAFAFPILLWLWGKAHDLPLQDSMSAYYWASIEDEYPPVRVWFVGGLFAIGSFLIIYKGYTSSEDWVLNLAAVLVILVALVPMGWNCGSDCPRWSLHYLFAIGFFLCIWYVALFEAYKTLDELENQRLRNFFKHIYWVTSTCMILSPFVALAAHWLTHTAKVTFLLELGGIYAFALFWLSKSLELLASQAERRVLDDATEASKTRASQDASEAVE